MTKSELIKWFENDNGKSELKVWLSKLIARLNKICDKPVRAGVEHSSFYVIDSEYHIFYAERKAHGFIRGMMIHKLFKTSRIG